LIPLSPLLFCSLQIICLGPITNCQAKTRPFEVKMFLFYFIVAAHNLMPKPFDQNNRTIVTVARNESFLAFYNGLSASLLRQVRLKNVFCNGYF
jgi:hypothetical protein